jgi:hypothetical protein
VQVGATIEGAEANERLPSAIALSADGSVLAVSSSEILKNGASFGYAKVFRLTNGAWVQRGATFRGVQSEQLLGTALALSADGSVLAICSARTPANEFVGWVEIHAWDGSAWQLRANLSLADNIDFGRTVALSANGSKLLIASASNIGGDGEKVLTYTWDGTSYVAAGAVVTGEGSLVLGREARMSADGLDMIAVAADSASPTTNAVLWYTWDAALGWVLRDEIVRISSIQAPTCFLSADGTTVSIAVGQLSLFGSSNGEVYVYKRSGTTWSRRGATISGRSPDSRLARSALSGTGDLLIIGGANDSSGAGYAAVFGWDGAEWVQRGALFEGSAGAVLGAEVALSADGGTVGIGAIREGEGRVRLFRGA